MLPRGANHRERDTASWRLTMQLKHTVSVGQRFGRWTVTASDLKLKNRSESFALCQCDCGESRIVAAGHLRAGKSQSCGCLRSELLRQRNTVHGQASRTAPAMYCTWRDMIDRCHNPRDTAFQYYGGRGITVCDRWRSSVADFVADMGPRPHPKLTLERIDNDLGYSPDNCIWATMKAQLRNTRRTRMLTHGGRTQCFTDWAKEVGIRCSTLDSRLRSGWSIERALDTPIKKQS